MISINDNKRLLEGFFTVCEAVSQTMGAQGKLAIMENEILGNPRVTKDGISTAKKIFFDHPEKNIGANLAKQIAAKTLVTAGDSTTTSLVFAKALVENSKKQKWFKKELFFNKRVEEGMDLAYTDFCKLLISLSKDVDDEVIQKIATVSSNNNFEIGDLVYKAYKSVGANGIIDVQENHKSYFSTMESSKGMRFNKGWESPFLINNQKTAKFEGENAVVVIYEGNLGGDEVVQNFLQDVKDRDKKDGTNTPIIIVAERFHPDTLIKLTDLNQRGVLDITAVQAPEYDVKRKALLEDLACFTGGKLFLQGGEDKNIVAGVVDKVIVTETSTSFIKESTNEETSKKITELKGQLEEVNDEEFIKRRIQNLEGQSATIFVGGVSESEIKEKFDRVDDAVRSIESAQEEGWIAGGGTALAYIAQMLRNKKIGSEETKFGYNIVIEALEAPFKQICKNANRKHTSYIRESRKIYGKGYNAYTDRSSNLIDDNILDSSKSIRTALENAMSVSKLLLNTAVIITLK
jgi:chaperonin GroEL